MSYLGKNPPPFGTPLPGGPDSVSVSMPRIADVVLYEEGAAEAAAKMQSGYPRFFVSKKVVALAEHYRQRLALPADALLYVYPTKAIAAEAVAYAGGGRVQETPDGVALAVMPPELAEKAKQFWQHAGLIVSSRQAADILRRLKLRYPKLWRPVHAFQERKHRRSLDALRHRVADLHYAETKDTYLLPTGMAAVFHAYKAVVTKRGTKTVQFGFPYTDILKVQQRFGKGSEYVPYNEPADMDRLEEVLKRGDISAVFIEVPSNPLLRTPDLKRLRDLVRKYKVPLIIDDTVGTAVNFQAMDYADAVVTSLTKSFVGTGKAMGGSVVLNRYSKHYRDLKGYFEKVEQTLYGGDARALWKGSRNFEARVRIMNDNTQALVDFLRKHPMIDKVFYADNDPNFEAAKKPGAGYGGLFSFTLKDPSLMEAFYDSLRVAKGPSLGTNFTIISPYPMLAHYGELPMAQKSGVEPHLLRVSVGIEPIKKIIAEFDRSLRIAAQTAPSQPLPWQRAYDKALALAA